MKIIQRLANLFKQNKKPSQKKHQVFDKGIYKLYADAKARADQSVEEGNRRIVYLNPVFIPSKHTVHSYRHEQREAARRKRSK